MVTKNWNILNSADRATAPSGASAVAIKNFATSKGRVSVNTNQQSGTVEPGKTGGFACSAGTTVTVTGDAEARGEFQFPGNEKQEWAVNSKVDQDFPPSGFGLVLVANTEGNGTVKASHGGREVNVAPGGREQFTVTPGQPVEVESVDNRPARGEFLFV